jgi:hypothetical protein
MIHYVSEEVYPIVTEEMNELTRFSTKKSLPLRLER